MAAQSSDVSILERRSVYFFYRPGLGGRKLECLKDIDGMYMLLTPGSGPVSATYGPGTAGSSGTLFPASALYGASQLRSEVHPWIFGKEVLKKSGKM